ncbi:MAG: hypothetical protein NT167_26645 [Verrucomicrobia bacterium]|nr:hypothetical protein [Verrucomicrobiota bacterium]
MMTPVREVKERTIAPKTNRVRARNEIALGIVTKRKISVNDLIALVIDHPEYSSPDGIHASLAGITAQANQAAEGIAVQLSEIQSRRTGTQGKGNIFRSAQPAEHCRQKWR